MEETDEDGRRKLLNRLAQRKLRSKRRQCYEAQTQQRSTISIQNQPSRPPLSRDYVLDDMQLQLQNSQGQAVIRQGFSEMQHGGFFDSDHSLSESRLPQSWNAGFVIPENDSSYPSNSLKASGIDIEREIGPHMPAFTKPPLHPQNNELNLDQRALRTSETLSRPEIIQEPVVCHAPSEGVFPPTEEDVPLGIQPRLPLDHIADSELSQIQADDKSEGKRTLHIAAENGHVQVVQYLLDLGAEIDARDASGFTALHLAVDQGYVDVVDLLIKRGADVSMEDRKGWKAVHIAARKGCVRSIRLLAQRGANLHAQIQSTSDYVDGCT